MPVQSFKVGEMLNKRTPNSKTWINFDGSYTTEIHQGIIHYEDASGNLHNINTDLFDEADFNEIDFPVAKDGDSLFYEQQAKATKDKKKNRLNRENYDFQGLAVPYECRIPRNIRRGYSIGKGASKLKFIPVGASVSKGYAEGNKITYPDVWNDADLVLELLPEGIKETIILKTDKAPINFSFEVQGELAEELKIQPMWLMDAEGTKRDVLQGVSEVDDKVLLDIAADTSNLVYPIEVDPTVTIQPDSIAGIDTTINSDGYSFPTEPYLRIGYPSDTIIWRGAIKFDLSAIPAGSIVTSSSLSLYQYSTGAGEVSGTEYHDISATQITTNWVETTTSIPTATSANAAYKTISSDLRGFASWNVSPIVQNWLNGAPNYGLRLDTSASGALGSTGRYTSYFYSSDYSTAPSQRPKIDVTYNVPPTAPVVTAPNGGETWNSLHNVEYTAATDEAYLIDRAVDGPAQGGVGYDGQTFDVTTTSKLKKIIFQAFNGGSADDIYTLRITKTTQDGAPDLNNILYTLTNQLAITGQNIVTLPNIVLEPGKYAFTITWDSAKFSLGVLGIVNSGRWTYNYSYWSSVSSQGLSCKVIVDEIGSLKYHIQLSTNNGSTWKDIVALTAAGATSYAYDFINEAETSTALIRVRAYDGSAYGPWDTSNGVFTIVHNQAPTAPTGLSPSGEPKDRASVVRFGWLHNDPNAGDPQSKFDLQWRVQGSPTWNTVTQATTNNYYNMPAGTLPKGTIEWQVRTYDQAGLPSPYSALQVFIAGDKPPTPTITGPVNGSVVPVSKPVVQWSSVDQAAYQVNVLNASGSTTLWTTGQVNSGNKAVTVGIDLENNTDYRIQTLVRGTEGIWSNAVVSNINVSYTPPALPILVADVHPIAGTITININNPIPQGTEPTVTSNDLYRREIGNVNWERIAANLGNNDSYTDYTVASDQVYEYRVIAYGDNGTFRESTFISSSVTLKGIYLHVISNAENTSKRFLMGEQKGSSTWNLNHAFHKFAGRQNFVIDTEDSTEYGVDFTIKLRDSEERKALENIIYSQEVVCFRDGRGRKVFGVFVTFPLEDAFWGESTSLNLTRIDYKEEVL